MSADRSEEDAPAVDSTAGNSVETGSSLLRVLTQREKGELRGQIFLGLSLDRIDFADADLAFSRFENVVLSGCSFERADFRSARFVRCDMTACRFEQVHAPHAIFDAVAGVTDEQRRYLERRGGRFVERTGD